MKKILFILFALIFFNSYVNAETFKFAQVTDVHFPKTGIAGYEVRRIKSQIIRSIIHHYRAEGIEFAFPSTSVYFANTNANA